MNSLAKYYASTNFKVSYPCAKVCTALQDLHSLVLLGSIDAIVIPSSGAMIPPTPSGTDRVLFRLWHLS